MVPLPSRRKPHFSIINVIVLACLSTWLLVLSFSRSEQQFSSTLTTACPETTRQIESLEQIPRIDVSKIWKYYKMINGRKYYDNKADFYGLERLFLAFRNLGYNNPDTVILVGGTNEGQGSNAILTWCPLISFYGFEIQPDMFEVAKKALSRYPSVTMINKGWSEQESKGIPIGGSGEHAGLFDPKGQRGWTVQDGVMASTVRLDQWTNANAIKQVMFLLIDTEGHEPKVIRGMGLEQEESRYKFPLFQYELGGTWAEKDHRHGEDPWDQERTARFLKECGYRLFLIGTTNWLEVTTEFFQSSESNPALNDKGYGPFVQGNILALHTKYAPKDVAHVVLSLVVVLD